VSEEPDKNCRGAAVGLKAEKPYGDNFFWVLVGVPDAESEVPVEYYIIPAAEMAQNVKECFELWVACAARNGRQRDPENSIRIVAIPPKLCRNGWDIGRYKGRWDLLDAKLVMPASKPT